MTEDPLADVRLFRGWADRPGLLAAVRASFRYDPDGAGRATGCFYAPDDLIRWPAALRDHGPLLLADLEALLGVNFPIVAYQAYRHGQGCAWHADEPFGAQAILSLGVTRTFAYRRDDGPGETRVRLAHGDLLFMPAGMPHCVPEEDVAGERCSLVFRIRRQEGP